LLRVSLELDYMPQHIYNGNYWNKKSRRFAMEAFEIAHLVAKCSNADNHYLEFIRKPSLSVGLYMLAAGAVDSQVPHTEDEIYYVVSGSGFFQVEAEHRAVEAGSVLFVPANVEHRFHSISQDMTLLVVFAPAEYTNASH
jgi:mannose-6-phosphate isomerase-like protein (cupin superfamily)